MPGCKDRDISSERYDGVNSLCLSNCIPTVPELLLLFNRLPRGKAFEENCSGTDVYKSFPKMMAKYVRP